MTIVTTRAIALLALTLLPLFAFACERKQSSSNVVVTGPASPQEERIRAIVAKRFDKKPETLDVALTLESQGLDVDELALVELVMTVEDELGVTIADETLVPALGPGSGDPRKLSIRILADAAAKSPPATGPATRGAASKPSP